MEKEIGGSIRNNIGETREAHLSVWVTRRTEGSSREPGGGGGREEADG